MAQYDKKLMHDVGQHFCGLCPSLTVSRKRVSCGYGALPSKVVFVGEAPGQKGCNLTGVPFTQDRSGSFFQQMMQKNGIDFEKVYTTNLVKCSPPCNRTPTVEEQENCSPFLSRELKAANPSLIVCVGKTAARFLTGLQNFSVYAQGGEIMREYCHALGRSADFMILPHPAAILRGGEYALYGAMWKKLKAAMDGLRIVDTVITDKRWENGD